MSRFFRSALTAVVIACSASLLLAHATAIPGAGQAAPQAARSASSITPEQAAPFIGDWLVSSCPWARRDATLAVSVKADAGKVTATVGSDTQPTVNVTDISLSGKSLLLKYITDMQGTPLSTAITLTPDGARPAREHGAHGRPVRDGRHGRKAGARHADARQRLRRRWWPRVDDERRRPTSRRSRPTRPRTPAEEAKGFMLPAGYRHGAGRCGP